MGHRIRRIRQSFSVEEFLKLIGDHLGDLNTSMDFPVFVHESADDGDQRQLAIFVCFKWKDHKPIEHFLESLVLPF